MEAASLRGNGEKLEVWVTAFRGSPCAAQVRRHPCLARDSAFCTCSTLPLRLLVCRLSLSEGVAIIHIFIKPPSLPRSSLKVVKAAAQVLNTLWQYRDLRSIYKKVNIQGELCLHQHSSQRSFSITYCAEVLYSF